LNVFSSAAQPQKAKSRKHRNDDASKGFCDKVNRIVVFKLSSVQEAVVHHANHDVGTENVFVLVKAAHILHKNETEGSKERLAVRAILSLFESLLAYPAVELECTRELSRIDRDDLREFGALEKTHGRNVDPYRLGISQAIEARLALQEDMTSFKHTLLREGPVRFIKKAIYEVVSDGDRGRALAQFDLAKSEPVSPIGNPDEPPLTHKVDLTSIRQTAIKSATNGLKRKDGPRHYWETAVESVILRANVGTKEAGRPKSRS
jgi:hypothetical protein